MDRRRCICVRLGVGHLSGRDVEPVAAFFPSIDRNLLRDLDRHLRAPEHADQSAPEPTEPEPVQQQTTTPPVAASRPTADALVEAVQHAASTMAAMTDRIEDLEANLAATQRVHHETAAQLEETRQLLGASETALREEGNRRDRAESLAAHHVARANHLEVELANALGDLTRVTDAIAETLGLPERGAPGR